jgi:hypothetical protein
VDIGGGRIGTGALSEPIRVKKTVKNVGPLKGLFQWKNEWERDKARTGTD